MRVSENLRELVRISTVFKTLEHADRAQRGGGKIEKKIEKTGEKRKKLLRGQGTPQGIEPLQKVRLD